MRIKCVTMVGLITSLIILTGCSGSDRFIGPVSGSYNDQPVNTAQQPDNSKKSTELETSNDNDVTPPDKYFTVPGKSVDEEPDPLDTTKVLDP